MSRLVSFEKLKRDECQHMLLYLTRYMKKKTKINYPVFSFSQFESTFFKRSIKVQTSTAYTERKIKPLFLKFWYSSANENEVHGFALQVAGGCFAGEGNARWIAFELGQLEHVGKYLLGVREHSRGWFFWDSSLFFIVRNPAAKAAVLLRIADMLLP